MVGLLVLTLADVHTTVCVEVGVVGSSRYIQELQHLELPAIVGAGDRCVIFVRETLSDIEVRRNQDGLSASIPKDENLGTLAIEVAEVARHLIRGEPLGNSVKVRVQAPGTRPIAAVAPEAPRVRPSASSPQAYPLTFFLGALVVPQTRLAVGSLASLEAGLPWGVSLGVRVGCILQRHSATFLEGAVESSMWQAGPYVRLKLSPDARPWGFALRAGVEGVLLPVSSFPNAGYNGVALKEYSVQGFVGTELRYRVASSIDLAASVDGIYGVPVVVRIAGAPRAEWGSLNVQSLAGVRIRF